ncbi:MAG: radical SAM protein [Methylophilaceae bacterium]|jgi:wyosine [tRNA(Phe)-imidazoG37] synthetase (radical SAM superfamily)
MNDDQYLNVADHNRDVSGLTYIYPVVSRRAGGVSIGINLNINNACNWRCLYCQVPNLTRGSPPPINLNLLENELRNFLDYILHGDFMERYVAEGDRKLQDIAFSGNGEPTSAKDFPEVLKIVEKLLNEFGLLDSSLGHQIKVRLITNGSLMDKAYVLESMHYLAKMNGEVWFKVDAGTSEGIAKINDVNITIPSIINRLKLCAQACPTFVQTCMVAIDGHLPTEDEIASYISLVEKVKNDIHGVHLYGLARPSMQAEAERLTRISPEWLNDVAVKIRSTGLQTFVSP